MNNHMRFMRSYGLLTLGKADRQSWMDTSDLDKQVYALEHIETHRLICALKDGEDYLVCFTDRESTLEMRDSLGLHEHCDLCCFPIRDYPITRFWLDGEFLDLTEEIGPKEIGPEQG
jgi:hypothetical protein